ncbi:C-type mannose receptor 2 [Merluccius polli]|uniref:C-type mannose receptor 2 n=1 Tax=Merluccius polli TaxID=89951 RepID=A0AA47NDW5_MERPO|nr:C-type mannose receptor 2 [Merluccius polli]
MSCDHMATLTLGFCWVKRRWPQEGGDTLGPPWAQQSSQRGWPVTGYGSGFCGAGAPVDACVDVRALAARATTNTRHTSLTNLIRRGHAPSCRTNQKHGEWLEDHLAKGDRDSPPQHVEASIDRIRRYFRIEYKWSWRDAWNHCRATDPGGNTYLAGAKTQSELQLLSNLCKTIPEESCWVSLNKYSSDVWRWADGENNSLPATTWGASYPDNHRCGAVHQDKLVTRLCSMQFASVCERNKLVLVKEKKTWEEALHHCRALKAHPWSSDLLSLHTDAELSYAQAEVARGQTEEAWVGLRWLAGRWLWTDGTPGAAVSMAACPANGTHCGSLSGRGKHTRDCGERRNFFCLRWRDSA